jgi:6-phosphogluconolactonase (cycloisomerase 2 family)
VYVSSASTNSIAGFELDTVMGTLTPIADSPFDEPYGPGLLASHPTGNFLYALNTGENSVSVFAIDSVTGALTEAAASPFAVGATGYTPKFLIVEPSGKFLYVASTLDDVGGTVTSVSNYAVDAASGAIGPSPDDTFSPGFFAPVGVVSAPQDKFLYLVGAASPANGSDVLIFSIEVAPTTGEFADASLLNGQGQFARSAAISGDGKFLFVGRGQSAGSIDAYTITDGTPEYSGNTLPIGSQALPHALAAEAAGAYVYAAVSGAGILGFSVDADDGSLTSLPSPLVATAVSASSILLADPLEPFLYFEQRAFAISGQGTLGELLSSPLAVGGSVTGIGSASPVDSDPGQPISAPEVALDPQDLQFADQYVGSASPPQQIVLSNIGTAPLTLSSLSLTGNDKSEFGISQNCPAVMLASDDCIIEITFQPMADGMRDASLTVVGNDAGSPHNVALTGTGVLPFTIQPDISTVTITAGQVAQFSLQLVPTAGFAGLVSLDCTGAPAAAVCDVPASLQLNGAPASFLVQVLTTARSQVWPSSGRGRPEPEGPRLRGNLWLGAVLAVAFALLFMKERVREPHLRLPHAALGAALSMSMALVSCAGGSGASASGTTAASPSTAMGTPAGQYALTVTAASGNSVQVLQLDLFVR